MRDYHIKKYNLNKVDIHIIRQLRKRRIELKLSQDDIAKVLGVNRSNIAQIEMGRNKVNHNTLVKLAQILDKPVSYFIGDEDRYLESQTLHANSQELSEILEKWRIKEFLEAKNISKDFIDELQVTITYLCEAYNIKQDDIW